MSIRARITLIVAIVVALVMALVVVVTVRAERSFLEQALVASLEEHVDNAQEEVEAGDLQSAIDDTGEVVIELFDAAGQVIGESRSTARLYEPDDDATPEVREIAGGDDADEPFLIVQRSVSGPDGPVTVVGVMSLAELTPIQVTTARVLAVVLLVVFAFSIAFTWFLTGRTLEPVDAMRRQAEAISAGDMSARIAEPANDRHLGGLARTLNRMLDRIESALAEQKRFASNASHELKSPLAATSVMLEALRDHPDEVDQAKTVEELVRENDRMKSIVDDLLVLTRRDEGRLAASLRPIDLMDLIFEEVDTVKAAGGVHIDVSGVRPVVVTADSRLLGQAIRNLLDNAVRYAGSEVAVSCEEAGLSVRIAIDDDGPGIAPADRTRAFERFVRLDAAQGPSRTSTGLGLSVVKGIVEQHSGTVELLDSPQGGTRALIELPGQQA